jgi:hypothetical protein
MLRALSYALCVYGAMHFYKVQVFQETRNKKPETRNRLYLRNMGQYSLGEAIRQFLKNSRLKSDIQALQIDEIWENLMGKTIAKYTDKIQIINGTLFITTHVAPLKQELSFQREKIKLRVNEALKDNVIHNVVIQ